MFKFKKKNLIYPALGALFIYCLFFLSSCLKQSSLNTLEKPLTLFSFIRHEIGGMIFYHRNMAQNERLNNQANLLRTKLNNVKELFLENQRLNALLSFKQKSSFKVIAARVIARPPDAWGSAVIVDKGTFSGIKPGMSVVTYLGLAGRVSEATSSTAKIILLNDPNLSVSALLRRTRQEGLVCGTLGAYLIMRYLPLDCDVKSGDEVITSGLSPAYPRAILIGTVTDIGKEFSGLSRYCLIRPAVNLASLEELLVVAQ